LITLQSAHIYDNRYKGSRETIRSNLDYLNSRFLFPPNSAAHKKTGIIADRMYESEKGCAGAWCKQKWQVI